ncbi:MAG: type II secretion system minor pseudopilin GspI [Pseudomonadota bacterium]
MQNFFLKQPVAEASINSFQYPLDGYGDPLTLPVPVNGNQVRQAARRTGFTLVEVLVALAIVAIAPRAALRAAGQGTNNVGELRSRLLAGWVAENLLAEHRARGNWLPLGIQRGTAREGGLEFAWRNEVIATPNPEFRRVDVFVFAALEESRSLAHLTGFVVQPPGTVK